MANASARQAFVDALHDPAAIVGDGGRITAANDAMRALRGGLRIGDLLVLSLRAPDVLDAIRRVLAGGARESVAWHERVPVEQVFDVSVAGLEIEGEPRFALVTLRDLTEALRVERMRVDFIANVSHELRTPLASLLGFVETLQGAAREDTAARDRFLGIMREQGRRMSRLIEDLLSLSRIEQHKHVQPQATVDLVGIVGHVIDTLTPLAKEHAIVLSVSAPQDLLVRGDRDELVRLAENLIENAIKYGVGALPAMVDVLVQQDGNTARFSVRDNGPGIAPEHLPRLTERFYRIDAGASRAKGGTGLGLAIVKHIVARHRGRLFIDSVLGQGTTFSVQLPAELPRKQ